MLKSKMLERLMRILITLLGVGVGAGLAAIAYAILGRLFPVSAGPLTPLLLYVGLCALGALIFFLLSRSIIQRTMQFVAMLERRWERMPFPQIFLGASGLILGLMAAFLITQLILSAGPSLITISFSAIVYLILGMLGMQIGTRRYKESGRLARMLRRGRKNGGTVSLEAMEDLFLLGDDEDDSSDTEGQGYAPAKFLDTSVIIDGRILDIAKTGFLEGALVVPHFVLAELRHIADSGDSLRRAKGRRGLDVLGRLQKEPDITIVVDETDYEDTAEVDVKLLRLCRNKGGIVVTNDYNLNKVAGVTGLKVLNINDLANALKPLLMAGEDLTVQITREGKEPGQGVAYLDDGTMIVVDNGRRFVGEQVIVTVTTVLQTSAGRMIFSKLKSPEEKPE